MHALLGHLDGASVGLVTTREPTLEDAYVALVRRGGQRVTQTPHAPSRLACQFALHFKMLSRSPFDLWVVIASPIIFATLAYFLFTAERTDRTSWSPQSRQA